MGAGFFVYFPITDTDVWWHLAAGRELIRQRTFFFTDPFSYSVSPAPVWIDLHWFFQVLVYGIYVLCGLKGLILFKCLVIMITGWVLVSISNDSRYRIYTALAYGIAIFFVRYLIAERPLILTLLCLALFLLLIERFRKRSSWIYLMLLFMVQVFWTNVQGLFILGPVVVVVYAFSETLETVISSCKRNRLVGKALVGFNSVYDTIKLSIIRYGAMLLVVVAATGINPYGFKGSILAFKLFERIEPVRSNIYSQTIPENIPLLNLGPGDIQYLYAVLIITIVVGIGFFLSRKDFRIDYFLQVSIFLSLAFSAVRNLPIFCVIAVPVIGYGLSYKQDPGSVGVVKSASSNNSPTFLRSCILVLVVTIFLAMTAVHFYSIRSFPKRDAVSPFTTPRDAVKFMKEHPDLMRGNIFNSIRFGGYLIWELYPQNKVFIDSRLIIRSSAFYRGYLDLLGNPSLFDTLAVNRGITLVVLPVAVFDLYLPLVKYLSRSPGWRCLFLDETAILFARSQVSGVEEIDLFDESNRRLIRGRIEEKWRSNPYIQREAITYFETLMAFLNQ